MVAFYFKNIVQLLKCSAIAVPEKLHKLEQSSQAVLAEKIK